MLRITVELVPHGDEDRKKTLDVLEIANFGSTSNDGESKYRYRRPTDCKEWFGHIEHQRSRGFWPLVGKVIKEVPDNA